MAEFMIKNPYNKGSYSEEFDMERLIEIAKLAQAGKAPNGTFSDLECNVWALMSDLHEGIEVK